MNKSEDYLDQLLKGMSDSRQDEIEAELKKELEEMGMFSPEYKQPIPKYCKRMIFWKKMFQKRIYLR